MQAFKIHKAIVDDYKNYLNFLLLKNQPDQFKQCVVKEGDENG
ncbi:MAG: hypothetical protein WCI64_11425 [Chlorobium sp.]